MVKGSFASLVDADNSKTALDRAHAQQQNADMAGRYEAQFAAHLDHCGDWWCKRTNHNPSAAQRARLPAPKPPTKPRLLKVAPDALVTLRLQLLPGLARQGVIRFDDRRGWHAVGEESSDSEDSEVDEDPTAMPGSPNAEGATADGVPGEDILGLDGVPGTSSATATHDKQYSIQYLLLLDSKHNCW